MYWPVHWFCCILYKHEPLHTPNSDLFIVVFNGVKENSWMACDGIVNSNTRWPFLKEHRKEKNEMALWTLHTPHLLHINSNLWMTPIVQRTQHEPSSVSDQPICDYELEKFIILLFWNEFESVRNVWSENKNYHKYQNAENQLIEDTKRGKYKSVYIDWHEKSSLLLPIRWVK